MVLTGTGRAQLIFFFYQYRIVANVLHFWKKEATHCAVNNPSILNVHQISH